VREGLVFRCEGHQSWWEGDINRYGVIKRESRVCVYEAQLERVLARLGGEEVQRAREEAARGGDGGGEL
jgi:hypothetical protein